MSPELLHQQNREILASLAGTQCACGTPKKHAMAFCRDCYNALSDDRQRSLYRPWNRGYQEAYLACVELLKGSGRIVG